jgi:hypothetical protein
MGGPQQNTNLELAQVGKRLLPTPLKRDQREAECRSTQGPGKR